MPETAQNVRWQMLPLGLLLPALLAAAAPADPPPAPATDWKEIYAMENGELSATGEVFAKEAVFFRKSAEEIVAIQKRSRQANGGTIRRGFHAKQLLGARATFVLNAGRPAWSRVGLFARDDLVPYQAWVRFSNGNFTMDPDGNTDIRGLAVKLIDTPGSLLTPDPIGGSTQDFLAINRPNLPTEDIFEFMALVKAVAGKGWTVTELMGSVGFFDAIYILGSAIRHSVSDLTSLATQTFFTNAPIRWGPYAAKIRWTPVLDQDLDPPSGDPPADDPDYLGKDLEQRLETGDLTFEMTAQFFSSEEDTPIEDANDIWGEDISPWISMGTLTIHQRDPTSDESAQEAEFVEQLSFSPWHAAEEFRPLGSQMRARKAAYEGSAHTRGAIESSLSSRVQKTPAMDGLRN